MTHVDLDNQPEPIREFLLALAVPPGGVSLELGGRPVAYLVPAPPAANGPAREEEPWTEARNQRRCDLIDRKYDHGLTPAEEAELAVLQDAMHRHLDRVAPLSLAAARELHQQLLEKAAKVHASSEP